MRPVIDRRRFLQSVACLGASAAGLAVLGGCGPVLDQVLPARIIRLGFFSNERVPQARLEALRAGLREHGWVEGQNLSIEERYADGDTGRLRALADELVNLPVDIIVGPGGPNIHAAREASSTTPIVITTAGDPVAEGLIASLARPGGNITGVSNISPQLNGKRIELLRDIAPGLSRVAVVLNGTNLGSQLALGQTHTAADQLGLDVEVLDVRSLDGLVHVFETLLRPDGIVVLPDVFLVTLRPRIVQWAALHQIPAAYAAREWVDAGGLMSYGPSQVALYRRAADYVDKILRGASPAELPIEQPTTFELVMNVKAAQDLSLTIPPHVAAQVTEWVS